MLAMLEINVTAFYIILLSVSPFPGCFVESGVSCVSRLLTLAMYKQSSNVGILSVLFFKTLRFYPFMFFSH